MLELTKLLNPLSALISFTFIFCNLLTAGCSSSPEYIPEKMDNSLLQKVKELEKEDSGALIQFAGKTTQSINDEMKIELEQTGIKTESIIQDIFTASGNAHSIKKVTLLDFVANLEMSKKLDMK
jgi:hypothetical protein